MGEEQLQEETEMEKAECARQLVLKKVEGALRQLGLTPFSAKVIIQFVASKLENGNGNKLHRVVTYLLTLIQTSGARLIDEYFVARKGCPQVIPSLEARPFWDTQRFEWISRLESRIKDIQNEFLALKSAQHIQVPRDTSIDDNATEGISSLTKVLHSRSGFQRYSAPASDVDVVERGQWNVCYLLLHGMDFEQNQQLCPLTMELIQSVPGQYNHAFFSALAPNSHIGAHYGPTNKKLRCYFPLFVPSGSSDTGSTAPSACWLMVNGEKKYLQEGNCILFDDSFQHEARNEDLINPRINLIFDIWHPDLTAEEIKVLDFINKGQQNAAKRLQRQLSEQSPAETANHDDFLSLIRQANEVGLVEEEVSNIWAPYMER